MIPRRRYHVIEEGVSHSIERKAFAEENGIKYFFHTAEKGHNLKHIHASYQGSTTVVGLEELVELVPSRLRPEKKQREAREFVAAHQQELIKIWNSIASTNAKSGMDYFRSVNKLQSIWVVNYRPSGLIVRKYMLKKRR